MAQVMGVRGHPAAGPPGLAVVVTVTAGGEPVEDDHEGTRANRRRYDQ